MGPNPGAKSGRKTRGEGIKMQADELKTVSTDGLIAGDEGRVSFQPE